MTAVPPTLDRVDIMTAAMSALLEDGAAALGDRDAVGIAHIRCTTPGMVVGLPVLKEVFGRMGARVRPNVSDGEHVGLGAIIADIGGPTAAIRGASPTAIRFLTKLSAVASGFAERDPGDPLEVWAGEVGRLSPVAPVGDAGPSFELEVDP
ncbi:MAG: Quinolinate phosphoribosyl transferase, N-terminal domain [Actinomycetota bacterium]|nr:Quinolinate phosphoribosyl transferase, N-terminal domain [Actinomycetota bacterium]